MSATFGLSGLALTLGPIVLKPLAAVFLAVPFAGTMSVNLIVASL